MALGLTGCDDDPLTELERRRLGALVLDGDPPADATNAVGDDPRAAALGQRLFFDARFSGPLAIADDGANGGLGRAGESGRVACASCHDPSRGGVDHRSAGGTSLGVGWTGRAAPTVYNAAYQPWLFWDGRRDSLWSQALGPTESPTEHDGSRLGVAHLLFDHYRADYEALFGPLPALSDLARFPAAGRPGDATYDGMRPEDRLAVDRVFAGFGKAIAAYERKLVDRDSPFDRFMHGERGALSAPAIRGAKLFVGRASCDECHSGPLLSDGRFHNHGVPQVGPHVRRPDPGRKEGIPGVLADPFNGAGVFSDDPTSGQKKLAGLQATPADEGAMRTPGLRGLGRTGPYMHTGGFPTLREVVDWYRRGAEDATVGPLDPASSRPLRLDDRDVDDLVAFLQSLDGRPLPEELVTAPVLP